MNELTRYDKWKATMVAKFGSEEAMRAAMKERSEKSRKNAGGTGGFAYLKAHDPDKLIKVSSLGGQSGKKRPK